MKIPSSAAVTLATLRKEKGLRPCNLAALAGVSPQKLCDYESGIRSVSESDLRRLCEALGVDFAKVVQETAWTAGRSGRPSRPFESLGLSAFCPDTPFIPERPRDFAFRLRGAWKAHPSTVARLMAIIDLRQDLPDLELFLRDFPADSSLEALADLVLLALGSGPAMLAPARLGFHELKVVDPRTLEFVGHRRRPALVLPVGRGAAAFLPQVGVDLGGLKPILDFLVGLCAEGHTSWTNIEVDGPKHDPAQDRERDAAVGLPVLRLQAHHLERPRVGEEILDWLLRKHAAGRPGLSARLVS